MQLPLVVHARFSSDGRWLAVAGHGEEAQLLEAIPTREYRTLVSSLGAGRGVYYYGDISPDGRLLALGMDDGTRLWDLPSGRELATLPGTSRTAFFDRIGPRWELLTGDWTGLHRWPVQSEDTASLRLGPPRHLSPLSRADFTRSPDGQTLAAVYDAGARIQILDLERGAVRQTLGVHPEGDGPHAVSADGRWLASTDWHSDRVRLWDAHSGELVHEWVLGEYLRAFFTPDSRVLVISHGDEYSFWDVETLQLIRRLRCDVAGFPGWVAFTQDGRLMALEMAPAVIHLREVATGRTVAKLEDPHGDRAGWLGFTPDGTQLVVSAPYAKAIHIWDLRAIRQRLKPMNLDWQWPEFPPATRSGEPQSPLADPRVIHVVGAEGVATWTHWRQRANAHSQRAEWGEAAADYSRAIQLNPDDPDCWSNRGFAHASLGQWDKAAADYAKAAELNENDPLPSYWLALLHLHNGNKDAYRKVCAGMVARFGQSQNMDAAYWTAWTCLLAPDAVADWQPVLQLAEKALAADPAGFDKLTTLGGLLYRAGQLQQAAKRLTEAEAAFKNARNVRGTVTYAWLFLALSEQRLGHAGEANKWLQKALKDLDEPPPERAIEVGGTSCNRRLTLQLLRREAEEQLVNKSGQ
jgi:Tfp pilus assembly protein PilF